jgi:hypothetical protein
MRFAFSLSSLKVNVLGPADSAIREPNCSAAMRTSDPASTCMTDLLRVRARADAAIGPGNPFSEGRIGVLRARVLSEAEQKLDCAADQNCGGDCKRNRQGEWGEALPHIDAFAGQTLPFRKYIRGRRP